MVFNRKIAALTALKRRNGGVNGIEPEKKSALTAFKRKNGSVNGVKPEN